MASIRDIPYKDIEIFLIANKKAFRGENDAYDKAKELLKDENMEGHTDNILEWIIAYNLLKSKVNIPNYTLYEIHKMSQNKLNDLAKLLTMKGNDVENIINILRFLHKLDDSVDINTNQILNIAGEEIFNIILSNMDNKTINRMNINKYSTLVLEDQEFWKNRLEEIFGLKSNDPNFDYRFAVKFLDNDKSFEENYHEAMDKGLKSIIKLLLENNVVEVIEPLKFLNKIHTTLPGLGQNKNLPYKDFIEEIIIETNDIEGQRVVYFDYFDRIEFTGNNFKIQLDIEDVMDDNVDREIKSTFISDGGFTNGEILYNIAQLIPNNDEIKELYLKHIRDNAGQILEKIEYYYNEYIKVSERYKQKDYNQKVTKEFLKNLVKSPEKFYDFIIKNSENNMNIILYTQKNLSHNLSYYPFLPDYSYYFGNHIYWEGLVRLNDEYHIQLGS